MDRCARASATLREVEAFPILPMMPDAMNRSGGNSFAQERGTSGILYAGDS